MTYLLTHWQRNRECLRFALKHCPAQYVRNRQRILASLVPIEVRRL
jgi:hypothetical protein